MTGLGPYAAFLGVQTQVSNDGVTLSLPFAERLIGAPGRLHGGVVGALLEFAGIARLQADGAAGFETLTLTVDYLRGGELTATHAAATVVKRGRRIINLHAVAWQDDRARPIATATLNAVSRA